jgi:hypothetical protein
MSMIIIISLPQNRLMACLCLIIKVLGIYFPDYDCFAKSTCFEIADDL